MLKLQNRSSIFAEDSVLVNLNNVFWIFSFLIVAIIGDM